LGQVSSWPKRKSGEDVAHHVTAADVDPGVFVDFAAEETGAVGAFFADDFGAGDERGIVEEKRATFAAGDVFRFVETLRGHRAESAEPAAAVFAEEAVGVVFDDGEIVFAREGEDGVHFAADARVVHGNDGAGARGDELRELTFVEVERVGADVGENDAGAAEREGVGGRDEGEGRKDDLVAGLDVEQQRGHLERVRAGSGDERARNAEDGFEQLLGFAGEGFVAGDLAGGERLVDVVVFVSDDGRVVERNEAVGHELEPAVKGGGDFGGFEAGGLVEALRDEIGGLGDDADFAAAGKLEPGEGTLKEMAAVAGAAGGGSDGDQTDATEAGGGVDLAGDVAGGRGVGIQSENTVLAKIAAEPCGVELGGAIGGKLGVLEKTRVGVRGAAQGFERGEVGGGGGANVGGRGRGGDALEVEGEFEAEIDEFEAGVVSAGKRGGAVGVGEEVEAAEAFGRGPGEEMLRGGGGELGRGGAADAETEEVGVPGKKNCGRRRGFSGTHREERTG